MTFWAHVNVVTLYFTNHVNAALLARTWMTCFIGVHVSDTPFRVHVKGILYLRLRDRSFILTFIVQCSPQGLYSAELISVFNTAVYHVTASLQLDVET